MDLSGATEIHILTQLDIRGSQRSKNSFQRTYIFSKTAEQSFYALSYTVSDQDGVCRPGGSYSRMHAVLTIQY